MKLALRRTAARQNTGVHTHGACRIMWGGGRSYPSNALNA